ncbi:MAG TPA: protein-glutamate O-methyltransferase CheR, partial [Candidatus Dormibacteraeota bacterium]|nr:protein-glutamate O-methyltransferase CheR [Candidatus Dormibacteraeota bacterium]
MLPASTEPDVALENLLDYLRRARGFAFTTYKRTSLSRRIQRRMAEVGVSTYEEYSDYLEVHADEFAFLFDAVLINVTSFFRDPEVWRHLADEVVPSIVAARASDEGGIRIWSAGCSSGEEVYSIAMLLAEELGEEAFRARVKIYGTDLDEEALAVARQASYPARSMKDVPEQLHGRYFERLGTRFVFRGGLRRSLIFGRHDMTRDAPISRLDLLLCRNTIMYLNAEAQEAVLSRFRFALRDEAFLCLGRAEMLLGRRYFAPVDVRCRVFAKVSAERDGSAYGPVSIADRAGAMTAGRQLRELAFQSSPVSQLVVSVEGLLLAANEEAKSQFSIHGRDIPRPLQDLEVSYRPLDLRPRIEQALAERRIIVVRNVERSFADDHTQYFDVTLTPVPTTQEGGQSLGIVIAFTDVTRYNALQLELKRSSDELSTAYEELQSANEELETSNEELQSANEELETTNEELQAANEELETTNEELQATNEELETMNDELRVRGEEVDTTAGFL